MQTDIKEASFIGQGDELVACGSDDGSVCIYRGDTGQLVKVLEADEDVANCVQVGRLPCRVHWAAPLLVWRRRPATAAAYM